MRRKFYCQQNRTEFCWIGRPIQQLSNGEKSCWTAAQHDEAVAMPQHTSAPGCSLTCPAPANGRNGYGRNGYVGGAGHGHRLRFRFGHQTYRLRLRGVHEACTASREKKRGIPDSNDIVDVIPEESHMPTRLKLFDRDSNTVLPRFTRGGTDRVTPVDCCRLAASDSESDCLGISVGSIPTLSLD